MCIKKRHIARACQSKDARSKAERLPANFISEVTSSQDSSDLDVVPTDHQQTVNGKTRPIVVTVNVNSKPLQMEVDTGAGLPFHSKRKKCQQGIQPNRVEAHGHYITEVFG